MPQRKKLSTTISRESYAFLESLVSEGEVSSMAEAVDRAVAFLRRSKSRALLEQATAAYFDSLSPAARAEETALEQAVSSSTSTVNFDE